MSLFGSRKHPRLHVSAGNQLGKSWKLKKRKYSIGSHKKCNIKIAGEYVSELHAIIELNSEGIWTLTNNSPNGTYVNQQQIDAIELDRHSIIQVGTDNRFEFFPTNYLKGDGLASDAEDPAKQGLKISKWHIISVATVLFYLPLFIWLKGLGNDIESVQNRQVLSLTSIERTASESRRFLTDDLFVEEDAIGGTRTQVAEINANAYDRLVLGAYKDEEEKNELVEQLVGQAKSHLSSAHRYIKMDIKDKAIKSLRSAMSVVPDHRNPATGLAAKTISTLRAADK